MYEISKELKVSSREVVWGLEQIGVHVKNHMSSVTETEAAQVVEFLQNLGKKEPKVPDMPNATEERSAQSPPKEVEKAGVVQKKPGGDRKAKPGTLPRPRPNRRKSKRKRTREVAEQSSERTARVPEGPVVIEGAMTVRELAERLNLPPNEIIRRMMGLGIMVAINERVDGHTAASLAKELGYQVEERLPEEPDDPFALPEEEDDPVRLKPRSPVVTVMGHVDHGKTSLLDAIRKSKVAQGEAGGITQHIGASVVEVDNRRVVFLDTPGHEAFTSLRARGAQVTDIVILVVAADDGVMPQTVEAINHAKAAGVPILVAINKIDKPGANPDRVKQQLVDYGLVPEEWGGTTVCVPVSAVTKAGLDELLEMLLLIGEMQELKADPGRKARGVVIEARLDRGRGPVATVLVQNGTLRVGDPLVAGLVSGRVRAMIDDRGRRLTEAGPAIPVEVQGLSGVPQAGDELIVLADEKQAREIAGKRQSLQRTREMEQKQRVSLDDLFNRMREGELKELNLVVKADVQGSVEALEQALEKIDQQDVRLRVLHGGVGAIVESDIMLASASDAIVIGFNVRPDAGARQAAEREKVDVRTYRVIYEALDDITAALKGMLEPTWHEVEQGRADVRATFKVPKVGVVAGCYITEGKVTSRSQVRVIRDGVVLHEGPLISLKRFKDDVREVNAGYECGIGVDRFNDIKEGDTLEFFVMERVQPE